MLDDVLPTLYFAWFWVRLQAHMLWLRLNKWLYFAALSPAKNARYIAVIGDGVAEGVGDWITLGHNPGLAGHLQSLIRKRNPGQIHRSWYVLNAGHSGAISYEWSPHCHRKPDRGAWLVRKSLYEDFVENAYTGAADIVVVFLGANDRDRDPVWTGTQVKALCEDLRARGKICHVMGLPNARPNAFDGESATGRARAISRYARKTQGEANAVRTGPALGQGAFAIPANRAFNGIHLNSRGYRRVAEVMYDSVLRDMVRVEFNVMRGRAPAEEAPGSQAAVDPASFSAPEPQVPAANPYAPRVAGAELDAVQSAAAGASQARRRPAAAAGSSTE